MSNRNTIPEFTSDPESLSMALRAMKAIIEDLTGQRGGPGMAQGGVPRVFCQLERPRVVGDLKKGDLWIEPASGATKFWNGQLWQSIAV